MCGVRNGSHWQQQASGMVTHGPHRKDPRRYLLKPHLPHQAQAQGLQHDEEFYDLGVPPLKHEVDEVPNEGDVMLFPEEDTIMMVYHGI
jgi:hypothetical protein